MSSSSENTTKYGMGLKTLNSYIIGLGLSLLFTLAAFHMVGKHLFSVPTTYISLAVLAILQLIAQVVFFLRMTMNPEGRWNSMPFLFAILIVAVLAGGSLWIMYNMNYNMMH